MGKTLQEYAEWLDGRDLTWPRPPKPEPVKATPSVKPLRGIRAVTWSIYGTLLRISDGQLVLSHPQQLRMQIALEKSIQEFNMWFSMSRKPGAPWEYMLQQYSRVLEDHAMAATARKGDRPQVNSARIWHKLLERLVGNEYEYDEEFYGDLDELSEKVAFFFHASLQGVEAAPNALRALKIVAKLGRPQGMLADSQSFTLVQMLRALAAQGKLPPLGRLMDPALMTLSHQLGVRKPSPSLYQSCLARFNEQGIAAGEILHIGSRMSDDLTVAKRLGLRTALYAGDKISLQASRDDLKDPETRPDRLMTDLGQIKSILAPT